MLSYKNLHNTSLTPSKQQLLDTALVLALLPHVFVIKPLMIIYIFIAVIFLIFKGEVKGWHVFVFALIGFVSVGVSFYETFNFVGLRRLNVFVSLIVSLLIVAVSLQRLSKQINFYILFSPALFLALSYFFYNSIMMLFYAISVLFVFLVLLLWYRMQSSFIAAFKMSITLFSFSLPVVVLLFLVFPRISFETKDFGFKGKELIRTGHDGKMHIGDDALLVPSKKVVMEVYFQEMIPPEEFLYFRGSVLYEDKTTHWDSSNNITQTLYDEPIGEVSSYKITLYPHKKRWLYFLDYPLQSPLKAKRDSDYVVTSDKILNKVIRYDGYSKFDGSSLLQTITPRQKILALRYDAKRDNMLYDYMKDFDKSRGILGVVEKFKVLNLRYSLQPKGINIHDPIDSFIFGKKEGYCVHFASTFAIMARMAGIPSRIVTGFKAKSENSYEKYLVVKEEDAHAWVEVYDRHRGWSRVEPTLYAFNDFNTNSIEENRQKEAQNKFLARINLNYMYVRYLIESWILDYTRSKQMKLLQEILEDVTLLLKFLAVFIVLGLFAYLLRELNQNKREKDVASKAISPLVKKLQKDGFIKQSSQSMESFLMHCFKELEDERLLEISKLYNQVRYGDKMEMLSSLEKLVKSF